MWPMNLTGPEFLGTYAVALAASAGLGWLIFRAWRDRLPHQPLAGAFSPLELGFAQRGTRGLVEVALASLHQRGLVAPGAHPGELVATGEPDANLSGVEELVHRAVAGLSPARITAVEEVMGPHTRPLQAELEARGAVYAPIPGGLIRWTSLAPAMLVVAVGVYRLLVGISLERPVLFLLLALAGSIGGIRWLAPRLPVRTAAFDAMLARLRSSNAALPALAGGDEAALLSPLEVATAAGLFGVAALDGPHFLVLEQMLRTPASTSSGSSSGADGGGCGGGCGGCGGCGG